MGTRCKRSASYRASSATAQAKIPSVTADSFRDPQPREGGPSRGPLRRNVVRVRGYETPTLTLLTFAESRRFRTTASLLVATYRVALVMTAPFLALRTIKSLAVFALPLTRTSS